MEHQVEEDVEAMEKMWMMANNGGGGSCNIPDDFKHCRLTLQTNTSLFSVFSPHSHAYRETS